MGGIGFVVQCTELALFAESTEYYCVGVSNESSAIAFAATPRLFAEIHLKFFGT